MINGLKLNSYNATYEEAVFDVIPRGRIFEIREFNSGLSFFIDKGAFDDEKRSETRTAKYQGHGEGHQERGTGDRKADDSSHEDDDKFQSDKHIWFAGEQIRKGTNPGRRIPKETVEPTT